MPRRANRLPQPLLQGCIIFLAVREFLHGLGKRAVSFGGDCGGGRGELRVHGGDFAAVDGCAADDLTLLLVGPGAGFDVEGVGEEAGGEVEGVAERGARDVDVPGGAGVCAEG